MSAVSVESLLADLRRIARARHRALKRARGDTAGAPEVRRRHCLAELARELGFEGWPHLVAVIRGREAADFGTLLYPARCGAHWNIWAASHDEARRIRDEHGGFLLAWRRQFLIVDEHYVRTLGLDPDDPDWGRIGRDWARPDDPSARARLYVALFRREGIELAAV